MRCFICAFTGDDAADGSSSAREFIACPDCHQLLYCSVSCAEVGWFGHRTLCGAQADKDGEARLATTMWKKWQQQEERSHLENALRHLTSLGKGPEYYAHALRLLDAISFTDDVTGDVVNTDTLQLIKEAVDLLTRTLTGSVCAAKMTTSITLLLSGLLSRALGHNEAALTVLRRGLAKLIPYMLEEDGMACWGLLETERMNIWTLKYPKVVITPGETPVSSRRIMSGEVVACDNAPLLVWEANGFPPALTPRQTSVHDEGLRALVNAFLQKAREELTSEEVLRSEEDLLTLLLNGLQGVKAVTADVIVTATTYLTAISDGTPPRWLVNLFFTAMTSRRRFRANEWGFFDLVSRVSHSCSPNCIWNFETCELRALRIIDMHEPLTMDNFWKPHFDLARQMMLKLPIPLRQQYVSANVGCLCACDRCTGGMNSSRHAYGVVGEERQQKAQSGFGVNGVDALRAFPCPLCRGNEGWRRRLLSHAIQSHKHGGSEQEANEFSLQCRLVPSEPWVCHRCGERWRDDEMPAEEMRLCRKAERLVTLASRGIIERNFFGEAKGLMHEVFQLMGQHRHGAYLITCEVFILFYRYIASRFAPPTGLLAQNHIVSWCRKWIRCAQNTNLSQDSPHVYASFIVDTSLSLTTEALRREKVLLLCHAEAHCPTAVIHGVQSREASAVAAILNNASDKESSTTGQFLLTFTSFMDVEEQEDEYALISDWELHILKRVQSEVQSKQTPNLPVHVVNALKR
ncbi:hypothetical protein TraAM80_00640 [Trypanosoma rangeli]|uniref:MYND-type domain-containing protein n=1 Tax=Trypanosoma rangeli TaxID=5698 RepID=A0A422P2Q4_TRYRA|nr:uncharacterized protein TraAM80_00640 [Trypanosoma rangeli]RNF11945.1 hypothetical protein TraAM80_00640 [Trypanosoma rangeli]|eukprot:RNF11945.1 hypothetical protein TraAM80_00640 [Trypanosoma rangeli]